MTEKPLHVRVAEALGWTAIVPVEIEPFGEHWTGIAPAEGAKRITITGIYREHGVVEFGGTIPHYDTDWSATGPLIERYGITLVGSDEVELLPDGTPIGDPEKRCTAMYRQRGYDWRGEVDAYGPSPLIAVCHLILALKEAGKL